MLSKNLSLDEIDKKIVQVVQKNPQITHTKIARFVKRSQPTVGMRIKRLKENGALTYKAGFDLNKVELYFAIVQIQTNEPDHVYEIANKCPQMIQAFKLCGINNLLIIIAADTMEDLEKIVNHHFRAKEYVQNISFQIITDFLKDFVIPLDFNQEECKYFSH